MTIVNMFLTGAIKNTLCSGSYMRNSFLPNKQRWTTSYGYDDTTKKNLIDFVFSNSKKSFPNVDLRNSYLNLHSFRSFAESEHFARLVEQDERILDITNELKYIYSHEILRDQSLSAEGLVKNHLDPLVKILHDPYLSAREFYTRALALKRNLINERKTHVSLEILYPKRMY